MLCRYIDAKNALDAILASFQSITSSKVKVYSGALPATLAAAATGLLSTAPTDVAGPTALWGAAASTPPIKSIGATSGSRFAFDPSIAVTGTAVFFRIEDDTGVARLQGTMGIAGSGADLIVNTLSFVAGGTFTVTSFDITITGIA